MTDKEKRKLLLFLDRRKAISPADFHQILTRGEEAFEVIYQAIRNGALKPRQVAVGLSVLAGFGVYSAELRRKLVELLLDKTSSDDQMVRSAAAVIAVGMYINAKTLSGIPSMIDTSNIVDKVREAYAKGIDKQHWEYVEKFLRSATEETDRDMHN